MKKYLPNCRNKVSFPKKGMLHKRLMLAIVLIFTLQKITAQSTSIVAAEYFFDNDPGAGNGNVLTVTPGSTINFSGQIPIAPAGLGMHWLSVRTRDDLGRWSISEQRRFYVVQVTSNSSTINAAEYYFNNDPGPGLATPLSISSGSTSNFSGVIPLGSLNPGMHWLVIRTRDDLGRWSISEQRRFYVAQLQNYSSLIVAAEYFINTDPGVGNGISIPISPAALVNGCAYVDLSSVPAGTHTITIRVKDNLDHWSVNETRTVTVTSSPVVTVSADGPLTFCEGDDVVLTANTTAGSFTYQWYNGCEPVNGATGNQLTVTTSGSYRVVVTQNGTSSTSQPVIINVLSSPDIFTITGGGNYCSVPGTGVAVGLAASETGVTYQLILNGNQNIGSPVNGTGGSISFGNQTLAGDYTVVASNGTCTSMMSGTATVSITQATTWYRDNDGDNFGNPAISVEACVAPAGYVADNTDCNDNNAAIYPGATEVCNGIDDDCDGLVDEGVLSTFYRDLDGDTYGNPFVTTQACTAPAGYVAINTDCNDNNAAIYPGATEVCNGIDDDCDGQVDEGVLLTFYRDLDGDTYGNPSVSTQACTAPAGYVTNNTDCNDNNAAIYPGATEVCNGIDDDCDGQVDEGVLSTFYRDFDGDTYGNPSVSTQACTAPAGYVTNNTDCNDNNAAIYPGATEVCNGVDDDCDGLVDEGCNNGMPICSFSQGFYGNNNSSCTPYGPANAKSIMLAAVDAQPGDSAVFGSKSTNRYFTLKLNDVVNNSIFNMLPAQSTPVALTGYATYSITSTWSRVPMSNAGLIRNILLGQTMTLFFNMNHSPMLGTILLKDSLIIAPLVNCTTPGIKDTIKMNINPAIIYCLETRFGAGNATVQNLLLLANELLGNVNSCNLSLSAVNNAVTTVNTVFDKCKLFYGQIPEAAPRMIYTKNSREVNDQGAGTVLFPNPADRQVSLNLNNTIIPGKINIRIIDMNGKLVSQSEQVFTGKGQVITIITESLLNGMYLIIVTDNLKKQFSEKLIIQH